MINFFGFRNIIILLYLIIVFYSAFVEGSFFGDMYSFLLVIYFLGFTIFILEFKKIFLLNSKVLFLTSIMLFFILANSIIFEDFHRDLSASLIIQVGVGFALIKFKYRFVFVISNIVLFLLTLSYIFFNKDLGNLMVYSSNTISVYSIAIFVLYYISLESKGYQNTKRNETFVMTILTVATCFLSNVRSGMGFSLILSIGVFLQFFSSTNLYIKFKTIFITIIILLVVGLLYSDWILIDSEFALRGMETQRFGFWETFVNNLDINRFVWGTSLNDSAYYSWLGNNPHNSFIRLNTQMGAGVIIVIYFFLYPGIVFFRNKKYILSFSIIAIFARAFFDIHLIAGNYLQFGIVMALFYMAYINKNKKPKNNSIVFKQ